MKRFLTWVAIIVSIFVVFIVVAYIFLSALFDTEPVISHNSYLKITADGSIPEYEPHDTFEEYLRGRTLDMRQIRTSLKYAAIDDRIKGVILRIGFLRTGFAKISELQQLIANFRLSGKKIYAHFDYGLTRDYYLATACDSIYMDPGGNLFLTGMAAEVTFYKGLFSKIGIEADFEHVGEFKNAPDVYTRQTMSDNQRLVIDEILDARYDEIVRSIAKNRNLSREKVNYFIEEVSGFSPESALESGLIDGIKYVSDIEDLLKQENNHINYVSAEEYSRIEPSSLGLDEDERIAVIYCTGTITGGEDGSDPYFGKTVGSSRMIRDLNRAADSPLIRAIILRINSPGGSSLAADKIWHAVDEARKEKPVIASISDLGASGGYYIALGADTILAQELSLIGSIGVFAGKFSMQNLYDKLDLNNVTIKKGKNATLFSLNSKFSDTERTIIRRMINEFYQKFVMKTAESRNKTYEEIDRIARGRVWDGKKGVIIDLIDLLGGLDDAIRIAKQRAGIDELANVRLIYYPKSRSFFGQFFRSISTYSKWVLDPLEQLEDIIRNWQMQPLALMPFIIN